MSDVRDFTKELRPVPAEGPTFQLYDDVFHCVPAPKGKVMAALNAQINVANWIEDVLVRERLVEQDVEPGVHANDVWEPTDDVERWQALMDDESRPVDVDALTQIVIFIARKYSGDRPTPRSRR